MKKYILLAMLFVTLASVAYAARSASQARSAALRADSIAAAADTARLVELDALGDSVSAYQLRIVQAELDRDALADELDARPVVRVRGELRVDTLRVVDTVASVREDSVEVYEFGGSDGPFTFIGDARLFPNRTQVFSVKVSSDPVGYDVVITCGDERPIRSASLLMTADDPFRLIPRAVQQDPDVCNAPRTPIFRVDRGRAVWAGVGVVVGFLAAHAFDDGFRVARY